MGGFCKTFCPLTRGIKDAIMRLILLKRRRSVTSYEARNDKTSWVCYWKGRGREGCGDECIDGRKRIRNDTKEWYISRLDRVHKRKIFENEVVSIIWWMASIMMAETNKCSKRTATGALSGVLLAQKWKNAECSHGQLLEQLLN